MRAKAIQYEDTWAAPGSELYRILTEAPPTTRAAQARKHYEQLERDLAKLEGRDAVTQYYADRNNSGQAALTAHR